MENNFSAKSSVSAGIAGYASPIFLAVAVLGLCIALFLIAVPGVAGQLDLSGHKNLGPNGSAAIPVELSMSTADQHLQIAESFNADLDVKAAQSAAEQDKLTAAK